MPGRLPSVFIGSSSEGLRIAREVELQLVNDSIVHLWTNGIFVLGEGTLESLMNALDNFDFAIMVLSPDDLLETRGRNYASPRDNVLFELGLFMGRLGRRRTIILSEEDADLKLPSDLAGITRATYRKGNNLPLSVAVSPACTRIIQTLHSQGERGLDLAASDDNTEFERMAKHITNYLSDKNFTMMRFETIRQNINPNYSDDLLLEMIDKMPDEFRRARLQGGEPGLKKL
jgi:hypothetical protein